jgi:altronate hydrolase
MTEPMDDVLPDFIAYVTSVAGGVKTLNETHHMQEIAIFKDGVTE